MTVDVPLDQKVVQLAQAFESAGLPYAIGGALAFAYYGEPRATMDVDINVFVRPDRAAEVFDVLAPLGVTAHPKATRGDRTRWSGPTALGPHAGRSVLRVRRVPRPRRDAVRRVPFGDVSIPILAPEDLLVCKTVFDRRKDWIDIDQILALTAGDLDVDDVRRWVTRIVGADDARLASSTRRSPRSSIRSSTSALTGATYRAGRHMVVTIGPSSASANSSSGTKPSRP